MNGDYVMDRLLPPLIVCMIICVIALLIWTVLWLFGVVPGPSRHVIVTCAHVRHCA